MHTKDFDAWNTVKKRINNKRRIANIRPGELRWVALGINVGSEIDGKGTTFTRPVLIVSISGTYLALVCPLSSKNKKIAGYVPFGWKGSISSLCINQTKVISQKRIGRRMGRVSENRLSLHKSQIKVFFDL